MYLLEYSEMETILFDHLFHRHILVEACHQVVHGGGIQPWYNQLHKYTMEIRNGLRFILILATEINTCGCCLLMFLYYFAQLSFVRFCSVICFNMFLFFYMVCSGFCNHLFVCVFGINKRLFCDKSEIRRSFYI